MQIDIIAIGNSKGIRIPKAMLEQCGVAEHVDIEVENNRLIITPLSPKRAGWASAFENSHTTKPDEIFEEMLANAFDESEWEW
ncbi:MAG: AbrB/MazE/SpoVT family DNA-binding domain-containing protein [Pseudomonadota bacterium]